MAVAVADSPFYDCEERWFCVLLRCFRSLSWRGVIESGKTSHLGAFVAFLGEVLSSPEGFRTFFGMMGER